MTEPIPSAIEYRRALEALRSGVPNEDAVRVMGCGQADAETRFTSQLGAVSEERSKNRQVAGLLVSGGFGSGKSHLLEYLEFRALSANFVCSRVVISKETPLYNPAKLYQAAVESAVAPEISGQAIQEIALRLQFDSAPFARFFEWCNSESGLSAIFPATLWLYTNSQKDLELNESIAGFWSGERLAVAKVRQGLKQCGKPFLYDVKPVPVQQLALERFLFAARLVAAAGYEGWVLLIDEIELVGRYSFLQRVRSYAEMARWMGFVEGEQYPGILAVGAITDDFWEAVVEDRGDSDAIRRRAREIDDPNFRKTAKRADTGIRLIGQEAIKLKAPDAEALSRTYDRLKEIHGKAYDWTPPEAEKKSLTTSRRMRSYVRSWITEWDLKRLYPGIKVVTEEEELKPTYATDEAIEQSDDEGPD